MRMTRPAVTILLLLACVRCAPRAEAPPPVGGAADQTVWVVDRNDPGPDVPSAGASLFDELFSTVVGGERIYDVPFPFQSLTATIAQRSGAATDEGLKRVLIPIGRSLQATRNRPDYFASPRVVVAVDEEPSGASGSSFLLRDRLFLGYQARGEIIEVISYNEHAGRFEFQIVSNYREGAKPRVESANRKICVTCHHGLAPIFPRPLWNETNANENVRALLTENASNFYGVPVPSGVDIPAFIDDSTGRAAFFAAHQLVWSEGCTNANCRGDALFAMLEYRLQGRRQGASAEEQRFASALARTWPNRWPKGLSIPNPDIPDRDVIGNFRHASERAGKTMQPGSIEFARFVEGAFDADVFDPRTPRKPIAVWRPADVDADFAREILSGLAGFFSQANIARLREALPEPGDESAQRLRQAIDGLAESRADGLSGKPLRPSVVIPELLSQLSATTQ